MVCRLKFPFDTSCVPYLSKSPALSPTLSIKFYRKRSWFVVNRSWSALQNLCTNVSEYITHCKRLKRFEKNVSVFSLIDNFVVTLCQFGPSPKTDIIFVLLSKNLFITILLPERG